MNRRTHIKILKRVIAKQMAGLPYVLTALEKRVDKRHTQMLRAINAEVREELEIETEYLQHIRDGAADRELDHAEQVTQRDIDFQSEDRQNV